ncbi:tripartite tricarboxylate transporter substrate binding protein [Falsiroseomonas sp.]|uniref:tripartite tricarboxylate transporter substrate binding protein n=1 Tax=Falsiroseomonas sp. TaxID=2870721 RepID=UPI003F715A61
MLRRLILLAGLALAPLAPALAQTGAPTAWPDRPIRLILPFGPGGLSDGVARLGAEWLTKQLGQPVVVDNRPGGNGVIGMEAVARAAPDGHTLLGASASHLVVLPLMQRLSLDPQREFAPIAITAASPLVLVVSQSLGPTNLGEFIAHVRARPGQLDYASGGTGGLSHLGMAYLLQRLDLRMEHVPYRSGPLAMQDILGGRIHVYLGNAVEVLPALQGNAVRLLGVTGATRNAVLPDVPTIAEQGQPGFEVTTWNGLAAPAGVPEAVRERIATSLRAACQDADFRERLIRLGTDPVCSTPSEMAASIQRLTPVMRDAIRLSGATVN